MSITTKFIPHSLIGVVSVLPAMLVMPAMATVDITADMNLNETYANGVIEDFVRSESGYAGTLTTPSISITGTVQEGDDDSVYLVRVNRADSVLNLGTEANPVESITVNHNGYNSRAVTVWDNTSVANLYAHNINISAEAQGLVTWGTFGYESGSMNVIGDNINVSADFAVMARDNTVITVTGDIIDIDAGYYGVYTAGTGRANITANSLTISSTSGNGIDAWSNDTNSGAHIANSGGIVNIETGDLTVNAAYTGVGANYSKSQVTINATGDVNVIARGSDDTRAIHAGNSTTETDITKENTSFVDITAKNINLTADKIGISAMSNGWVDLHGNVNINAKDAILARGHAHVNINESGEDTVKMNGNVNFDYYSKNSGSLINAYVNVNLANEQSYWTGNTVASYLYKDYPGDEIMEVDSFNLSLANGATWNATQITDTSRTFVDEKDVTYSEGEYYIALNNLSVDKGTVNIADTTRGITVENANVADATFNGGKLNIGNMTLSGGKNTFNNNVFGIDNTSALTVGSGAELNLGTNSINVNTLALNGTVNGELLDTANFASFDVATFSGDGDMNLTLKSVGTYNVFKNAVFANTNIADSSVFDYSWNDAGNTITVSTKSASEIIEAIDNVNADSVNAVVSMANAKDETAQQIGNALAAALANGDTETVEHEVKKLAPAEKPVTHSVATNVQQQVLSLTANRMTGGVVGRAGGDEIDADYGFWAQGIYNKSRYLGEFDGQSRGVAVGFDALINKIYTLGIGYAFSNSDIDMSGDGNKMDIDSHTVFVYGQYKPSQWFINATLSNTVSKYTEKAIVLGTPAKTDYDVNAFGIQAMTGYDFASGITPMVGMRYLHVTTDGHQRLLGYVDDSQSSFLSAVAGLKYAFDIQDTGDIRWTPELRALATYDVIADKNGATVYVPGGSIYHVAGNRMSRGGGELGMGLKMEWRGLELSLNYDLQLREDYLSHTGMVKLRCEF